MASLPDPSFSFSVRHTALADGASADESESKASTTTSVDTQNASNASSKAGNSQTNSSKTKTPSASVASQFSSAIRSNLTVSSDNVASSDESDSEDSRTELSGTDLEERSETPQLVDLSAPITRTRKAKATPRRLTPVMHIVGDEELSHRPASVARKIRFFVFTPTGRAISMELSKDWKSVADICAHASSVFLEAQTLIVPAAEKFVHAYFYPSMADVDDLEDIRSDDQIVVVTAKLEPGQVLNGLGGTRMRSHSISALPSPRGGAQTSEWSYVVPVVEPSFHPSTPTFEQHTTSESERFAKDFLKIAIAERRARIRGDHISDIVQRIESFASVGDRACWTTYSAAMSQTNFESLPAATAPAANSYSRISDYNPTTPRGGIAIYAPSSRSTASTTSIANATTPRSVGATATGLTVTYLSHGTHISPRSDADSSASGEGSRRGSVESFPYLAPSIGLSTQQLRHAFEWERSENEIRSVIGAQNMADKWEERDKLKKERSRQLSPDEEKEAKKIEKRHSKLKLGPQKGIAGALGTIPRSKPDNPSRMSPSMLENAFDSPEDIVLDPTGKVIGLKLDRLIQRLTSDSFPAAALAKSFLLTYRLYMSPSDLVSALEARWNADGPPAPDGSSKLTNAQLQSTHLTPSRLRLITLVKQWAFKHGSDDFDDGVVRNLLFSFAAKMERSGVLNLTRDIEAALFKQRASIDHSVNSTPSSSAPTSLKMKNGVPHLPAQKRQENNSDALSSSGTLAVPLQSATNMSSSMSSFDALQDNDDEEAEPTPPAYVPPIGAELFDFHPLELARQITIIEKAYLDALRPQEMLNLAWTKKNKEILAPNVLAMIRFSNYVVDWMCTEILKPADAVERAMVINRLIYVGQYCWEMNNFNGSVEVLSALRRSSVYRLKRSWNYLSDRAWNVFDQMELLFEPDSNYKNYRAVLEKAQAPCIPYLGRLLSDILFLEEKEPNMLSTPSGSTSEMVNLVKLDAMASILRFLIDLRHHDYKLSSVDIISSYLFTRDVYTEKQAYSISLDREKKVSAPPTNTPAEKGRNFAGFSGFQTFECSPSALTLEDAVSKNDIFTQFRSYLVGKTDSQILMFYKQVHDWSLLLKGDGSDQLKRARELAIFIFDAFISERADQQIAFAKDAFIMANLQEIEWKVRDDSSPLNPRLFRPLTDTLLPVLNYHFDLFRRSLPLAQSSP